MNTKRHTDYQHTDYQHTDQQDTGKQDTGKQDTGKQDTGKQDTGKQDTGHQPTGKRRLAAVVVLGLASLVPGCIDAPDPVASSTAELRAAISVLPSRLASRRGSLRAPLLQVSQACQPRVFPTAVVQTSTTAETPLPNALNWRYSIESLPMLYVGALLHGVCGGHLARFDIFAPDGTFHSRRSQMFVADSEPVQARPVGDGYAIEVDFPIAGTEIAGSPLTGLWTIKLYLDNGGSPVGTGLFELYR